MIFVDTNVLIYLENPNGPFFRPAFEAIVAARQKGRLAINSIIFAELAREYPNSHALGAYLARLGIMHIPSTEDALFAAAQAFKTYRAKGGPRGRILPDFFIGADALCAASPLLTNDPALYKTYFPDLELRPI